MRTVRRGCVVLAFIAGWQSQAQEGGDVIRVEAAGILTDAQDAVDPASTTFSEPVEAPALPMYEVYICPAPMAPAEPAAVPQEIVILAYGRIVSQDRPDVADDLIDERRRAKDRQPILEDPVAIESDSPIARDHVPLSTAIVFTLQDGRLVAQPASAGGDAGLTADIDTSSRPFEVVGDLALRVAD